MNITHFISTCFMSVPEHILFIASNSAPSCYVSPSLSLSVLGMRLYSVGGVGRRLRRDAIYYVMLDEGKRTRDRVQLPRAPQRVWK